MSASNEHGKALLVFIVEFGLGAVGVPLEIIILSIFPALCWAYPALWVSVKERRALSLFLSVLVVAGVVGGGQRWRRRNPPLIPVSAEQVTEIVDRSRSEADAEREARELRQEREAREARDKFEAEQRERQARSDADTAATKAALERMEKIVSDQYGKQEERQADLRTRYPLGYIIFGTAAIKERLLVESTLKRYEIDPQKIAVEESPEWISITLPDIYDLQTKSMFSGNRVVCTKGKPCFSSTTIPGARVVTEVISGTRGENVFVIGFAPPRR